MDGFQDTYRLRDPFADERPALPEAADRTLEALRYAAMNTETAASEAKNIAEAIDNRIAGVLENPRDFGYAHIREAEHILALASRAADAIGALRTAIYGRRT